MHMKWFTDYFTLFLKNPRVNNVKKSDINSSNCYNTTYLFMLSPSFILKASKRVVMVTSTAATGVGVSTRSQK